MLPGSSSNAIEINRRLIYKQLSLCLEDASVTKVAILKETADVTLAILDAAKAIKINQDAFKRLANHAADLIAAIWRSYKTAKILDTWLSPQLRDILRGLLENLYSILTFFEEQVSTNMFLRMMYRSRDMRRINRYHQRLMIALDKFEIQSHIAANRLLLQLLEKQEQFSNQIQHRKGVKKIIVKRVADDSSTAKANKGAITWKAGQQTPNLSSQIDELSEDGCPLSTDEGYSTATWTFPSCPPITLSSSGKSVIINQGTGNVVYSNLTCW